MAYMRRIQYNGRAALSSNGVTRNRAMAHGGLALGLASEMERTVDAGVCFYLDSQIAYS